MDRAPTIWISGLSRSGKTVLAEGLAEWLQSRNIPTQALDGRAIRSEIGDFLGYSRDQRMKVSRIMCTMASLLNRNGVTVIATSITPYQESRDFNRLVLENYFEIFLDCPVEVCVLRDDSDNYARAMRGDLKHFIGVDDPFEIPKTADLTISTDIHDANETLRLATDALESLLGL